MCKLFDLNRIDAIKVKFKKPIFEDSFVEKGMIDWFTDIIVDKENECYELFFDFGDFEFENNKYFKVAYYDSHGNLCLTAKDVNVYSSKYSVYFGDITWNEEKLENELNCYLQTTNYPLSNNTKGLLNELMYKLQVLWLRTLHKKSTT